MKYPEMVKTNARYRGPMESRKFSNAARDIMQSIQILKEQFSEQNQTGGDMRKSIFSHYNKTITNNFKEVVQGVTSVKGGEL